MLPQPVRGHSRGRTVEEFEESTNFFRRDPLSKDPPILVMASVAWMA